TTGCRADGVVVWATLDKSAGRAGIKSFLIEKDTPGFLGVYTGLAKMDIRNDNCIRNDAGNYNGNPLCLEEKRRICNRFKES
ncbi:MAG: hypothetical protein V3R13_03165, partial [Nitrososphaerales archaeon]